LVGLPDRETDTVQGLLTIQNNATHRNENKYQDSSPQSALELVVIVVGVGFSPPPDTLLSAKVL